MLFEWLFERRNPGPVGRVDGPPERWTGHAGLYRGLFALAGLVAWIWYVWQGWPNAGDRWTAGLLTTIYLALAYAAAPRPDMSNIGLWGTPINHPLRFTDNINRMQMFFLLALAPGRLIAAGLVDLVHLMRSGRIEP
ncbi:MAG: hypothetical protein IT185_00940 [Acidobacteria bacterium]|nr:hypothetical protein [Acidobacteriota bacterium]